MNRSIWYYDSTGWKKEQCLSGRRNKLMIFVAEKVWVFFSVIIYI